MMPDLIDVREQHKLSLESGPSDLGLYDVRLGGQSCEGTIEIAKRLGFKHPRVSGDGISTEWVMTTDQVLVTQKQSGHLQLLAVSYKPDSQVLTRRKRELLAIEKAYWDARAVPWILITPDLFDPLVGVTLRRNVPWGLGVPVSAADIDVAVHTINATLGHTFTFTLNSIGRILKDPDPDRAQRALWQSVWRAAAPVDLRMGWRPHLPLKLLSTKDFDALNPVICRRSSWI
jgi:hypothetical protein